MVDSSFGCVGEKKENDDFRVGNILQRIRNLKKILLISHPSSCLYYWPSERIKRQLMLPINAF